MSIRFDDNAAVIINTGNPRTSLWTGRRELRDKISLKLFPWPEVL